MDLTNKMFVVGLGEVLWDMLPEGKQLGGAPANFAHHVAQCGMPAYLISAVGEDALGEEIRSAIKEKGLDATLHTVPYPTGTVDVTLDDQGVPQYDIREGAAWDNIPFTAEMEELAKHTAVVCFGTLAQRSEVTRKTIEAYVAAMPEEAVKVCDINLRGNYYSKEVVESSLKMSDMIKVNYEELEEVCRLVGIEFTDQHSVAHTLIDNYGLDMLVVTCGTEGSFVYCMDENASCVPTPKVEVVDTVGAGDAFTGVFVSGMLGGLEVRWAHMLAVEAAAFVCTQAGATPELPEDIKERV